MEREERKPGDKQQMDVGMDPPEREESPKEEDKRKGKKPEIYSDEETYTIICLGQACSSGCKKSKIKFWQYIEKLYITNSDDSIFRTRTGAALNIYWERLQNEHKKKLNDYKLFLRKKLRPEALRKIHTQILQGIYHFRVAHIEYVNNINTAVEEEIESLLLADSQPMDVEGTVQKTQESNEAKMELEEEKLTKEVEKEAAEDESVIVDNDPHSGMFTVRIPLNLIKHAPSPHDEAISIPPKPWTEAEDAVLRSGEDSEELAALVRDRGVEEVSERRRELGLL